MEYKNKNKTKKPELIDTESRLVVARGRREGVAEKCEGDLKTQMCSYKINKSWGCNVQNGAIVLNTVLHIWKLLRVNI